MLSVIKPFFLKQKISSRTVKLENVNICGIENIHFLSETCFIVKLEILTFLTRLFCSKGYIVSLLYHNDLKFLDSHVCANSEGPDQTAIWSGSSQYVIPSASFWH